MPAWIVVHPGGYNNPFYGSGGIWQPDRGQASRFPTRHAAESIRLEHIASFSGGADAVIVDDWDHPEVEEALRRCFLGDFSQFEIVQKYNQCAGGISLQYFVRKVLIGERNVVGGFRGGCFYDVLQYWEKANA